MKIDLIEAHTLANKILYANLLRALNDSSANALSLSLAVKPFFAIQFSRELFKGMEADAYRFSVILTRLRRSPLEAPLYRKLISHVKTFLVDKSAVIPYVFEEWRRVLVLSGLESEIDFPDWIPILNDFAAYGFHYPSELAQATRSDIQILILDDTTADAIWKLWRFVSMSDERRSLTLPYCDLNLCSNASSLAAHLRAKKISDTPIAKYHEATLADLGLDESFQKAGPAARIRILQRTKVPLDTLNSYLNTGAQVNTLRQVQGSLRRVASGVQ